MNTKIKLLTLGRAGWSYDSEDNIRTSGCYGTTNTDVEALFKQCLENKVPILDSRNCTLSEAFEMIKGDRTNLKEFIESKKHITNFKYYNVEE